MFKEDRVQDSWCEQDELEIVHMGRENASAIFPLHILNVKEKEA